MTKIEIITMLTLLFIVFFIAMWIYGIILAFSSNLLTGIIVFLIEPLPVIVGISQLFGYDILSAITDFIVNIQK